jgi:iron complex outermembrane receptor protein
MHFVRKPLYILVLSTLPLSVQAEHLSLPDIEVIGKHEPASITQPGIDAARLKIEKTAGGVTIVDIEKVKEGRNSNFADTLGLATGVLAQSRFGAEETRLSIRGSGVQRTFHGRGIKLMQDGIAVNLADGSFDFSAIDPMATSYVEVYRGANALQYGASNLGGAVNFISHTGYTAPALEVRSEGGSYGYHRLGIATGRVIGDADYYLSASTYHSDSFRDNAQQSADRLTGNVGYKINNDIETRFYLGYINNDSQLSSNLSKAQLKDNPKQATLSTGQGINERDVNLWRIANKTTFAFDHTKLELGAFYSQKSLFHPIIDLFVFGNDTLGVIDQESDDYGLTAKLTHQGKLFGLNNEFIAGISPTYGKIDAKNYRNVNAHRGALVNDFDQTATNFEAFFEDRLQATDRLTVVAGLQYARAGRESKDQLITATGNQSVDESYAQTSPKLGILYQLQPQVQLFSNISRSFEPPSFGELNNAVAPTLKAQSGTTFEVGTRGNSEHVDWDVAVYHARLHNELLQVAPAISTLATQTVNADKTVHTGLEFGMTARLPMHLEWRHSMLINNFKLKNDQTYGSNRLPGIQRSLLRAELMYRGNHLLHGLYFGPTIEWSPQAYNVDFADTLDADKYFLWGLKAGQKVNANWSWFLEGRNLANQKYAATTGVIRAANATRSDAVFSPGDGRTAYLGVQWNY